MSTSTGTLDFPRLAQLLLSSAVSYLKEWLPGGKVQGEEYVCGSLKGGEGRSCSVNLKTGKWADFATGEKGGDLVSLYAAIEGVGQGDAFKKLSDRVGLSLTSHKAIPPVTIREDPELGPPPSDAPSPDMGHHKFGKPTGVWAYRDTVGNLLFYIARYDYTNGTHAKHFSPWSWDLKSSRWVQKAWPAPRPLYGLENLAKTAVAPIMIVEGERSADAARKIAGHSYLVVTWPNGSKAFSRVDWAPLANRKILLWPDNDTPGVEAMLGISEILKPTAVEIKILDVSGQPDAWDAADALQEGWDYAKFIQWAKPRVSLVHPIAVTGEVVKQEPPPPPSEAEPDEPPISQSAHQIYNLCGIETSENGAPVHNVSNVIKILRHWEPLRGLIWFDEFHQKIFTTWNSEKPREWRDIDDLNLMVLFQAQCQFRRMTSAMISDAVRTIAYLDIRNEPRDWLKTLVWDGVARLEEFFIRGFGVEDTPYTRTAGKNWLISVAARIMSPGCKVDTMIVLEDEQGKKKSSAIELLAGGWFCELNESVTSKDFFLALQGKLIVEIAELDTFSRAEVNTIKKVISCRTDRFRPPYERHVRDWPRSVVFIGTTNEDHYLKDHTGGRRFWPMRITGVIDMEYIASHREQIFAEAMHQYQAGATWWEMPLELTREAQEARRQPDPWEELIANWIAFKPSTTVNEIATQLLKFDFNEINAQVQNRIFKTLRVLGWETKVVRVNGDKVRRWVRKGTTHVSSGVPRVD